MSCDYCNGTGDYPIYDRFGHCGFEIECPACFGSGMTEKEQDLHDRKLTDQIRYDSAMREMRESKPNQHTGGII